MKSFPLPLDILAFLLLLFVPSPASLAQHRANIDKTGNLVVTGAGSALTLENLRTGQTTSVKPLTVTEAAPPPAANYTFRTVPAPPGATSSYVYGISSDGTMIAGGYFGSGQRQNGFLHGPSGQQVIAYPGALETTAVGVNDSGVVVGNHGPGGSFFSGFFYQNGKYTSTKDGKFESGGLIGINDLGAAVGIYDNPVVGTVSVLLENGTVAPVQYPGSATFAAGINVSGEIVGTVELSNSFLGFSDVNGVFATIQVPGATETYVEGISNDGNIAGFYGDATGHSHGFTLVNGQFTTVDYPGAVNTLIYGIDDAGDVAGVYAAGPCTLAGETCGFVGTAQ